MSDIVDTINRLEAWVRNYGHEKQPAFIADLKTLICTAKAVSRAVEVLHGLEDMTVTMDDCEAAIAYARAVDHAVAILWEGQQ